MKQSNYLSLKKIEPAALIKHISIGAGIALVLIAIFLSGVGEPDPKWPKLWMLKPLFIVPLTGAIGGLGFYMLISLLPTNKVMTTILGLVGYIIVIWMGFILGLNGTMWD
jgi:hypothetical protein